MSKIYEPRGKAREYSPLALNYIKGCDHGCVYCYVPPMMTRFNSSYIHRDVKININYKEIEQSARSLQGVDKQILLSFTTDPYAKAVIYETRKVLEILNFYGHKVAILTKGGKRCLRDIDIFKAFGDRIKVGASLTFDNDVDSREWEHGAALPMERIETLEILAKEGVKTWVSFEPTIIPEQTLALIKKVAPFIHHVKIGKINNYKSIDKNIDWAKFLDDAVKICRQLNVKFYIKNDLAAFNKGTYLNPNETDQDYLSL